MYGIQFTVAAGQDADGFPAPSATHTAYFATAEEREAFADSWFVTATHYPEDYAPA